MDPNGSQYNILIRVTAAQARREIAKLKAELAAINAQMAKAGAANSASSLGPVAATMRQSASATAAATSSATAYANAMKSAGGASASSAAATDKLAAAVGKARVAEIQLNEVRAQGTKATSSMVAADAKLSASRNAAIAAANKVEVAELRLQELKAKGTASNSSLAAAEARLSELRSAAVVASQKVAIAEMALTEAKAKGAASASTIAAAEERLMMARRAVVGANAAATASQDALTNSQVRGARAESGLATSSTLNRMRTLGATTVWAGKQISMFFTAPLLLAGAAAFKWQMDNEKAAAHLVKVYDDTSAEAKAAITGMGGSFQDSPLDKFFTALSERMGQSKSDITEMAAEWAAVGATGKQLANLTRITSEAMVLGDLNQKDATEALIAIQAQYKLSSQDLFNTLKQMNAIENATAASMGDLITAYSNTAAVARSAGIDQQHLGAMIAALVPATGSAAKAGNGLKSIISKFADPDTDKAINAFEQLALNAGLAADAFLNPAFKSKNMTQRLEEIADVYGKLTGQAKIEFAKRVGGIFQISRAEQLLGDIYNRNTDSLSYYKTALNANSDAAKTNATYQKELQTVLQSNPNKFKQVGAILQNSLTDVIIPLIPHILWLAKGVATLAKSFSELDPTLQKWIVIAAVAVALIGPISSLIGGFILLGSTVGKSFTLLGRTMSRLLFHFTGLRTGAYMAGKAMGDSVPLIKKLGNMFKWLFGIQAATDAGSVGSTSAAETARVAATAAGEAEMLSLTTGGGTARTVAQTAAEEAQLLAITAGGTQKVAAEAATQAAMTSAVAAGQTTIATVYAASAEGIITIMRVFAAQAGATQAAVTAELVAGQSAQLAALTAGTGAQASVYMASQAGQVTILSAGQAAALAAVTAGQAAIQRAYMVSAAGQVTIISTSRALVVAAEAQTQAALLAAVIAGSRNMGRVFLATQAGHVEIINAARPMIVAAETATQTALVAATTRGELAQVAAVQRGEALKVASVRAGAAELTAASTAGGAAASAGAAAGATKAAASKKSGVLNAIMNMFMFIPGLGKYLAKAGTFLRANIGKVFSLGGLRAAAGGSKIVGLFTGPIGWAITAAITLISLFPKQIGAALKKAWDAIWKIAKPIMGDSDVPILARPFVAAVEVIKKALLALPKIVVGVFKGVVSVIQAAGQAVYKAFSYINPFAHHSPSLVENVREGMAIVTNEFSDADKSIQSSMRSAYNTINKFGSATAGLNLDVETRARNKKREEIMKVDPGSLASYNEMLDTQDRLEKELVNVNVRIKEQKQVVKDAQSAVDNYDATLKQMNKTLNTMQDNISSMNETLDALQKAADYASNKLSEAQDRLDKYANAPIKGMKAMEDQIFANEMAQKKLQLALMNMNADSVDDVTDKFAKLQGEVETLSGTRNELRVGGAGSDILGVYDDQIAALKAQQQAVNDNLAPIQAMEKELERLKTEADRLDLEKSLKFDPLTRQIQDLANTTEELSFDQITSGIRSAKGEVNVWTSMVAGANAAVNAQQAAIDGATTAMNAYQKQIDAVQEQRDAAQDKVDQEQKNLNLLQETYDQMDQTLQDLKTSLDEYNTSLDTTIQRLEEEARAAEEARRKAEEEAKNQLGGGATDFDIPGGSFGLPEEDLKSIEDQTNDLVKQVQDSFGKIDLLGPLKSAWGKVKDFFSKLWNDYIWPELQKLPGQLGEFLKNLPNDLISGISYLAGYIAGALVRLLWESLKGAWNLGQWIGDRINDLAAWVTTADNWKTLGSAIWNGLVAAWDAITSGDFWKKLGELGLNIIVGILKGIGNAIVGIGKWLWDNVIWPIISGFMDGFDMHSPSKKMMDLGVNIIQGLIDGLVSIVQNVIQFFIDLPGKLIGALGDLGGMLVDWAKAAWNWLRDKMPENIQNFMDWIAGIPKMILDKLGDGGKALFDFGKNLVQGLLDGAGSLLNKIGEFFLDKLPGWIKEPFKKALGIHSPSKVFADFGGNVGEGLVNGITAMIPQVAAATASMADAVASTPVTAPNLQVPLTTAPDAAKVQAPTSDVPDEVKQDTDAAQVTWTTFGSNMQNFATVMNQAVTAQIGNLSANTQLQFAVASVNSQTTMSSMQTGVTTTATLMRDNVVTAAKTMTDQVTTQLTSLKDQGVTAMQGTKEGVTTEFQSMSDNLNTIFNDQVKPMFDSFQPMLTTTEGWFSDSVKNIGTQWSGIQEKVAEPSRFVVNKVYNEGVKGAWNKVNTWLGLPPLEDYVAKFETGGVVNRDSLRNSSAAVNLIRGGKMKNYGAGDRTLYAGQGGEYVLPKKMAASIGYDRLEAARKQALTGGSVEGMGAILGFQQGGTVPGAVLDADKMLLEHARGQAYVYGGSGPDGFDCSGIASAVWNTLTGQPNLWHRAFTTEANFGSYGFERGLNGWATIGVHNGGGGMLSHMAGTLNGKNYESGGAHDSTAYGGPAAGSDHPQFENQYTLKDIGGVFQSGGMGGAGVPSMVARVMQVWKEVMDPIGALTGNGSPLADIKKPAFDKYNSTVGDFLKGKADEWDKANRGRAGGNGGIGAGVEVWRPVVQEVLKTLGLPLGWDEITLSQMMTESGGNQYALNDWDQNWIDGHPSKGLMQVTDPTFADFHFPGYPYDIWDPKANIAAGLRQVVGRHGGPYGTWGEGHGYDSGGWLMPGLTTAINMTKKPEAVLTNSDWNAIYQAANDPLTVEGVAKGVEVGLEKVYGYDAVQNVSQTQAEATAAALNDSQGDWQQNIYDETAATTTAVQGTTAAVTTASKKGIDNAIEVGGKISDGISKLSTIMLAVSSAMQNVGNGQQLTFSMIAPVLDGVADLVESLPDAEATYVPWAGFDVQMTEEMKRQKAANDAANAAKGLYQVGKTVLPSILRSVSTIGSAVENLIQQDAAGWAQGIALLSTGNPMGALIIAALVLKEIFTILPLILKAIMDIVPNLIKAIIKFLTDFAPDATYSYDNIDDAVAAVTKNEADIKSGVYQAQWEGAAIDAPVNQSTTMNFYGDIVLPNITSGDQAQEFSQNLSDLAEG